MRLDELLGYRKYQTKNISQILQDIGLEVNSSGTFSRTILTNDACYKLWTSDIAYETYLNRVVLPLQHNPFVPQVLRRPHVLKMFMKHQNKTPINVIKLERLHPIKWNSDEHDFSVIAHICLKYAKRADDSPTEKPIDYLPKHMMSELTLDYQELLEDLDFCEWFEKCVELNFNVDTHRPENNMMLRGKQPVFIDPVWSDDSDSAKYGDLVNIMNSA